METKINLQAWIGSFILGDFDAIDVHTQIKAGWYDWFCKDSSLAKKTKRMGNIIKNLREGGKVDFKSWYVWFKNNCPLNGPLYDDFRFADLDVCGTREKHVLQIVILSSKSMSFKLPQIISFESSKRTRNEALH